MATSKSVQGIVPPPPPPDRIGVSMTCINIETDKVEPFKGEWDGTQAPWIYTFVEVHYRMEPDGTGYKPVRDRALVVVVDIQKHVVESITVKV